jgi:hypothetical protein
MLDYKLEHIFSYNAKLSEPEAIGPVAEGNRAIYYSRGGEVNGPRVQGKLRSVGGDWLTIRQDGVALVDVRTTFETDDGALIYAQYNGIIDAGENGYDNFLKGNIPAVLPIRTAPRFSTAHPSYLWLNRLQCIGIGEARPGKGIVHYDVYALR